MLTQEDEQSRQNKGGVLHELLSSPTGTRVKTKPSNHSEMEWTPTQRFKQNEHTREVEESTFSNGYIHVFHTTGADAVRARRESWTCQRIKQNASPTANQLWLYDYLCSSLLLPNAFVQFYLVAAQHPPPHTLPFPSWLLMCFVPFLFSSLHSHTKFRPTIGTLEKW